MAAGPLRLRADLSELDAIYAWLEREAAGLEVSVRTSFALQVVLEEIATNVARHGGAPERPATITLDLRRDGDFVLLTMEDDGAPFDPTTAQDRPDATSLATAEPGGKGLRLMRHYAARMQYSHTSGRNQLRLWFAR